jgi:hypothetical protein
LSARVLSDFYESVTVLEQDDLDVDYRLLISNLDGC